MHRYSGTRSKVNGCILFALCWCNPDVVNLGCHFNMGILSNCKRVISGPVQLNVVVTIAAIVHNQASVLANR